MMGVRLLLHYRSLYGGGIASLIASLIAGIYRIYLGGAGMYAGVASVIVSAVAGLVLRRVYNNSPTSISLYIIIAFANYYSCSCIIVPIAVAMAKGDNSNNNNGHSVCNGAFNWIGCHSTCI